MELPILCFTHFTTCSSLWQRSA